jgi:prevent-host-death family protein
MVNMLSASISETKAKLSALLDRVKAGEEVTITDRGTPVARIVSVPPAEVTWDERLDRLERHGLVRRPKKPSDVEAFLAMPKGRAEASVLEALLEERREDTR